MRIIGGQWRGRRIRPPHDPRVRPTADRVREAWMSIVLPEIPGASVVDLFAGSGALGLEALSRGAARATFVELDLRSIRALRENIATLEAGDSAIVRRANALTFIESLGSVTYDVAFADPPYRLALAERVALRWLATPFARVVGIEHAATESMPDGGETRRYGDSAITFYRVEAD